MTKIDDISEALLRHVSTSKSTQNQLNMSSSKVSIGAKEHN